MKMSKFGLIATMLAVAAGCRTINTDYSGRVDVENGRDVRASGGLVPQERAYVQVKAPPPPESQTGVPKVVAQGVATASGVVERMRVLVSIEGVSDDEKAYADLMRTDIEGALAKAGYRVVYTAPAEILLHGKTHCGVLNSRGTRVVQKGDVTFSVTRAPEYNKATGQTLRDVAAKRRFDVQGDARRGNIDAIKDMADKTAAAAVPWVADGVLKVGADMEVMIVTIDNAWFLNPHSDYPTRFTQTVNGLPGVYSVTILMTDNTMHKLQARVVYDRHMFPDGLLNRLYTIRDLNIHR